MVVPGGMRRDKLHEVIQVAIGWTNCHLHQFVAGEDRYIFPHEDIAQKTQSPCQMRRPLLNYFHEAI